MAENQRHSAASSSSLNSYCRRGVQDPVSAADFIVRIISGKGITFAVSNTSSTLPPIVQPRVAAPYTQTATVADANKSVLPCLADTVIQANRKSELLPT